jgi:hypothetical protein
MRRFLIGCATLALFSAPAAAQYYDQQGYYHAPRHHDHYVAPKPKPRYQGNYHYQAKPKYQHHGYQREHYTPPAYHHAPSYRY